MMLFNAYKIHIIYLLIIINLIFYLFIIYKNYFKTKYFKHLKNKQIILKNLYKNKYLTSKKEKRSKICKHVNTLQFQRYKGFNTRMAALS